LKYRAEIDGLRALAVVPVILFHAGFELFSGGFVGVDVFFVISGYLITVILIEDIENDRFSLINFYERRARRILPALFFVMFVCIPFAWMWMLPSQMKDFSQSLVAVSLFASNVLFFRESGYFDAAAEEKPLLHTWSLAVEEQYYVLFPIFLFLAWRYGKNRVFWMIIVMASVSLLLSEWGWRNKATANFYLAPTRAWELFAGSIAAFVVQNKGVQKNDALSFLGLAAIIFSIFAYDESTPFPSVYALVPVLGVVMLILFADKETITARLLSTKAFVGIGLISYSAYLWHQPLFAFARIRMLEHPSYTLMLILCLASIFLAYLSWRYVEKPFRAKEGFNKRHIFIMSSFGLLTFIAVGISGHLGKINSRFDLETFESWRDDSDCLVNTKKQLEGLQAELSDKCLGSSNNFILIGDSHANSLSLALRRAIENSNGHLISLIKNGCLPIIGTSRLPVEQHCVRNKQDYWQFIETTNATVILSSRWRLNLIGSHFDNQEGGVEYGGSGLNIVTEGDLDIMTHVEEFLNKAAENRNLIIINQIPEAGWNVPERSARLRKFTSYDQEISTSYQVHVDSNAQVVDLFNRLSINPNINIVNVEQMVCNTEIQGRCLNTLNGQSLYLDDDHPSPLFANIISDYFADIALNEGVVKQSKEAK
jgi:peptidoglycan/LPS O-acetylase OafA/YrhL